MPLQELPDYYLTITFPRDLQGVYNAVKAGTIKVGVAIMAAPLHAHTLRHWPWPISAHLDRSAFVSTERGHVCF
jgi:hypothetical protein